MAQHSSGRILVGGKDINSIPLRRLRLAVHVLPQDPVIFEQSLRQNLDPWSRFSDLALCEALKVTGLLKTLQQETMAKKFDLGADRYAKQVLDMQVKGNGENFSKGQMQLICLARAILLKPKILILDEGTCDFMKYQSSHLLTTNLATASIDPSADKMIQEALKTCSDAGTTIICIAHRLSSVAWMDRIVVMDAGRIVSDGTPSEILD